jgi:hypothetical protein
MEEIDAAINQVYTDYMKKNEKQPTKLLNAKNVIMTAYAAGKKGQYNPITLSLFAMDKDMQKLDKLFRQLNQMAQPKETAQEPMFKKGGIVLKLRKP